MNVTQHDIVASFSGSINLICYYELFLFLEFVCIFLNVFYDYSILTQNGTGYEIFVDNNGRLIVGILTKKEYFATSVSSSVSLLVDKK